ncbi:DNA cytosine methyltransferase [Pontibacter fetidus]|uniref:DNA cytosine methyltransferase n=1 Tax=Pontibacter fetidus TaxID=2700082 RepID=UPI00192EE19D|nr:DNA cytosine methyltransferase [Pontibacter fetidus]
MAIPVIDIFAGPGGLGEGFSSLLGEENQRVFTISLSIEKDSEAHKTLTLRSFFRQFPIGEVPEDYYSFVRGEISIEELYRRYPDEASIAIHEAWQATLGKIPNSEVDKRISEALNGERNWLLIGGPPCQAYSVVGRSRRQETVLDASKDHRVELYKQYLRILAVHSPAVFVMENVKGILSAKTKENSIFSKILNDLSNPAEAFSNDTSLPVNHLPCPGYKIFSLVQKPIRYELDGKPVYNHKDFIIYAEEHGIPQTRHRVILLGIRNDIDFIPNVLNKTDYVALQDVIDDLPKLRSGLSKVKKVEDTDSKWLELIQNINFNSTEMPENLDVFELVQDRISNLTPSEHGIGGNFIPWPNVTCSYRQGWYHDPQLLGIPNHSSRGHMGLDLHRYIYASCFGILKGVSPKINDFPISLYPLHKNVDQAINTKKFADRFRVQLAEFPAKTVTSHISKDGHYYIHPDPLQCRSLTVREAARVQTFPDNYFFCGSRTSQFIQVGNAVPPLLAYQIADIVADIFGFIQFQSEEELNRAHCVSV